MKMRNLAIGSAAAGASLPPAYHRRHRLGFAFGFPAFAAVLVIFWLLIARPEIGL